MKIHLPVILAASISLTTLAAAPTPTPARTQAGVIKKAASPAPLSSQQQAMSPKGTPLPSSKQHPVQKLPQPEGEADDKISAMMPSAGADKQVVKSAGHPDLEFIGGLKFGYYNTSVSYSIHNGGKGPSGGFSIKIIDGTLAGSRSEYIKNLAPGQTMKMGFNPAHPSLEHNRKNGFKVRIVLDHDNRVKESNEEDNTLTGNAPPIDKTPK
jgi:hypothetical protein